VGLVRQKGVEAAQGDIVVSTDADCTFPIEYIEKVEEYFAANAKRVLLGGPILLSNPDPWSSFILSFNSNFIKSYLAGWGVPLFWGANTSFRKDAFMLTEGYKGAGGHGPVEEWVVCFRLGRVGEWMWSEDVYVYTKLSEHWRTFAYAAPLSVTPLAVWGSLAVLQGVL